MRCSGVARLCSAGSILLCLGLVGHAQSLASAFGKILRLDPDNAGGMFAAAGRATGCIN